MMDARDRPPHDPQGVYSASGARPVAYWSNGKLLRNKILGKIIHTWPLPSSLRSLLHQWRGVHFVERRSVFIGDDVVIDLVFPENIVIGRGVMITNGLRNSRIIWRRSRWKICAAVVGCAICMLLSAASCRKRSRRADECSGPCPS